MATPTALLEEEEITARKVWVRCREPHMSFRKDKLVYPDKDDKEHKDDPPTVYRVDVVGFDEFGDGTCPCFEVEDGPEISDAINNDKTMHPVKKIPIFNGRLVSVSSTQLTRFPRFIGTPTVSDPPLLIAKKVRAINREKLKGDAILGRIRPDYQDCRMPHGEKASELDNKLWLMYQEGMDLLAKEVEAKKQAGTAETPGGEEVKKEIVTAK